MLNIKTMALDQCAAINEIDASQYIGRAWRDVDGARQLVDINYFDPTWPNGFDTHYNNLRATILENGEALGAYDSSGKLLGFATVNRMNFGKTATFALLDQLFVTKEMRGKGIGKQLFLKATEIARKFGAEHLFICAGSAEETIAFYHALGCVDAIERHEGFYESDPRDFQLTYKLSL